MLASFSAPHPLNVPVYFYCSSVGGDRTRDLLHARTAFYHRATTQSAYFINVTEHSVVLACSCALHVTDMRKADFLEEKAQKQRLLNSKG